MWHVYRHVERLSTRTLFFLPNLLNSIFLCAQAMMHARGLYNPHATSEHDLHIKRFVSACSVHWYLSVPSTMKIATSVTHRVCVSVACTCALHCGYMEQNFSKQRACWRDNTHQGDVAEWPNGGCGPRVSQSEVDSLSQSFWW